MTDEFYNFIVRRPVSFQTDEMQLWLVSSGVSIELSSGKDRSLTVVLTGKGDAVRLARKMIVQQLQTQVFMFCVLKYSEQLQIQVCTF